MWRRFVGSAMADKTSIKWPKDAGASLKMVLLHAIV